MTAWTHSGDHLVAPAPLSNPAVASLTGGGYVLAWASQNPEAQEGGTYSILAQRFDQDGFKIGAEMVLNAPLALDWAPPRIALDGRPDGGFVAAWNSERTPVHSGSHDFFGSDFYMRRFDESGIPLGEPTLVNDPALGGMGSNFTDLHVVALSTGREVVVWNRHTATFLMQIYDESGNLVFGPLDASMGHAMDFVPDASGGFYAVRTRTVDAQSYWVEHQHFSGTGEALSAPVFALPLVALDERPVGATLLKSGELLIARGSRDTPTGNLYLTLLRHDPGGGEDQVEVIALPSLLESDFPYAMDFKAVAQNDGGFVVSWTESVYSAETFSSTYTVVAQGFDAAALPLGDAFYVKDTLTAGAADYDIAALEGGGIAVTWETDYPGTYVERFGLEVAPAISAELSERVSQLYVSMFGRAPDGEGLAFWAGLMRDSGSASYVANMMYDTAPARAHFPSGLSDSEIVSAFYVNVLGRQPDAEGLAFWTGKMVGPEVPGSFIEEIIAVVADYTGSNPAGLESAALFDNRVAVAQYYGEHNASIAAATHALDGVTSNDTTVAEAIARLELVGTSAFASVEAPY